MKIPSTLTLTVLAGLSASCSNQAQPFAVERFIPLNGCATETDETIFISGGSLDVAAGSPQFFLGVRITSSNNLAGPDPITLRNGEILEQGGRNPPIITQQVVTYKLSRRLGSTPKPFTTAVSLPFGTDGFILSPIQIISAEFGAQLFDGLTPSPTLEDFVDIEAQVEFKGEFATTRTPFTTGTLSFPIRAFRSAPTACGSGQQFKRFPFLDPNDMVTVPTPPNFCRYAGQLYGVITTPLPPTACCTPGTVGC